MREGGSSEVSRVSPSFEKETSSSVIDFVKLGHPFSVNSISMLMGTEKLAAKNEIQYSPKIISPAADRREIPNSLTSDLVLKMNVCHLG